VCINNGRARRLRCLSPNCAAMFPHDKVPLIVTPQTLEKYRLYLNAEGAVWCPRPGCDTPVKQPEAVCSSPKTICPKPECGTPFCLNCKTFWHANQTCDSFQKKGGPKKTKQEIASNKLAAEKGIISCPFCGIWTEKDDGCEHVKCTACHRGFCWFCLEPHDHNMAGHKHGPKYATHKAPVERRSRDCGFCKVLKYAGIGVAAVILGPPAIAVGAVVGVLALPVVAVMWFGKLKEERKERKKHNEQMHIWARGEKQRRERIGLGVCQMVYDLAQ